MRDALPGLLLVVASSFVLAAPAEKRSTMTTSGAEMRQADRTREQLASMQKQWTCYR